MITARRWLAAVALCLAGSAAAQHDPSFWCTPKTVATPQGQGSSIVWAARLEGGWAAWWCPIPAPQGQTGEWFRPYYWAGLYSYGWSKMPAASERVHTALDPSAQAKAEVFAAAASAANAIDACKHRMMRRDACIALRTTDLGASYPAPASAASAAERCGTVQNCAALPPPPQLWRAVGGALYVFANNRPSRVIVGRTAPANEPCNCSTPTLYASATYCPLADASPVELTMCRQAAQ